MSPESPLKKAPENVDETPRSFAADFPTPAEAKAWDIKHYAEVYEATLADDRKLTEAHDRLGTPMENRRRKEDSGTWKLVRELTELTQNQRNDSAEIVAQMSPDAQAEFARQFYENTIKADGNPSVDAIRTYQQRFAGTPFGNAYKALVQENYTKRGIEQDIDTVRL
ncbi:MAG TPA: hypothetical protein VHB93_02370 [Candidatus Paceibacterota bacterium]|nr:hypothetical protein [Candidatus Paceibacterota bacterium]